jgi:hypothetical protein
MHPGILKKNGEKFELIRMRLTTALIKILCESELIGEVSRSYAKN